MKLSRRVCTPTTLELPFLFEPVHGELAEQARQFALRGIKSDEDRLMTLPAPNAQARIDRARWVAQQLGAGRFLQVCVPAKLGGRAVYVSPDRTDARAQCLVREALAWATGPAEGLFAMQCLVSQVLLAAGGGSNEPLLRELLGGIVDGSALGTLSITESEAGSDPGGVATTARKDGDHYVLTGTKTYVSLAGVAQFYVVLARTSGEGTAGLSAFVVRANDAGVHVETNTTILSDFPMGTLKLEARIPAIRRLSNEGDGMRVAMQGLDGTRCTLAAAAVGMARRAIDESLARATSRKQFGRPIADFQLTRAALAEMAADMEAARLMAYRAAYARDVDIEHVTYESAQAKYFAAEAAQRVVDRAVQLFGAAGLTRGNVIERLYRDVRTLRIYEGTAEVQKLVVAGILLGAERARANEEKALQADRGTTRQLRAPRVAQAASRVGDEGGPPDVDTTQRHRAVRVPKE